MEWALEILLVLLLAATLFHAVRLERALGMLKRDRSVLEELAGNFNASTQQAETGIERLHAAADGVGRQVAQQIEAARAVKDDLVFLSDRGERLADRLDTLVRAARPLTADPSRHLVTEPARRLTTDPPRRHGAADLHPAEAELADAPRMRSQAERDLLKALRMAR